MNQCPELGALESSPLPPELRDHVSSCDSCRLVVEVFDAAAGRLDVDDCMMFDALLAARSDGTLGRAGKNLLERHLASCETCREVAQTLSPTQDADGDQQTLPEVNPAGYALGLEVGRGGMGRILAARDLRVGRPIAIKELLGRSPQLAARFEREARVTARLQHPGIVPIYEIGKWPDGTPFYSMRMVDGGTLADAIDSQKTFAQRLALLPAVIAATEAVAFAHAKRVIHRDLTPSNILVGAYGETVVIDWGLAKDLAADDRDDDTDDALPENSSEKLTGVGAVIGTATYMPPEQAHAVPVDERADVYALGAILYHLLAGAPPYRAKTAKELLRAVKTAPPPPIEQVMPGTPRDLVSIITKAMARDPDARYPSARELAEELKRFQTGRLVEAHAYSRWELFKRFLERHRAVVTVIALALAISTTFGTLAIRKILASSAEAQQTARALILEKGRIELLAGNTQRALAYLYEAKQRGETSPSLKFLLGSALRSLATSEQMLDCGENGSVRTIAFDPTHTYVAGGCHEVARVWRISDGKELAKIETGENGYDSVLFSGDGKLLATWGGSGIARLWNWETGELRATLDHGSAKKTNGAPVEINRASFSPNADRFLTTGANGIAIVWDVVAQTAIHTLVGSDSPIPELRTLYGRMSPDGKTVFAMTILGVGHGWDAETGKVLGRVEHGSEVYGGDLAPNGRTAVSCGYDGQVRVWNLKGEVLRHFASHTDTTWKCIYSPDSRYILAGGQDGLANIYDLETGVLVQSVEHDDVIVNADFTPDARRFATTGLAGRVKLWDTRTGALLADLDGHRGKDARFADNERLAVARGDGRIEIWKFDARADLDAPGTTAKVGNRGAHVVYEEGSIARTIAVRELASRHPVLAEELDGLTPPFAIADAAPVIAAYVFGAGIRVVDITRKVPAKMLLLGGVEKRQVTNVTLSADGTRVAVMFATADAEIWDVASAQHIVTLGGARFAMLSEDGRRAVAWSPEQQPTVWNVDAKKSTVTLASSSGPQTRAEPLGFVRGGTRIALRETADVTLWNAATGERIAKQPSGTIAPSFDPTGTWLTTIDIAHTLTVWSTDDGAVKKSFLAERLLKAQVNPDATFVAAIAEYGTVVLLMRVEDGRILARWPIEHPRAIIKDKDGYKPPTDGSVGWTHDGSSVISRLTKVDLWRVSEPGLEKRVDEIVKSHVPFRSVNGDLEWLNCLLRGVVKRGGAPQAKVPVVVKIRTPPDIGAAPINWESSKNRVTTQQTTTNALGEFAFKNLLPGEYTLTVDGQTFRAFVSAADELRTIELQ